MSVFTDSKIHKPNCNFKKQNKNWQTKRFKLGGLVREEACFAFVGGKQQCLEIQLGHRKPLNNKGVIGKSKANSRCVQVKYCNDFDLASLFQLATLSNRCPPSPWNLFY